MRLVRYFSIFVLFASASLHGMRVNVLDRHPMYTWENSKLSELVLRNERITNYDPSKKLSEQVYGVTVATPLLVENFIDSCCVTKFKKLHPYFIAPLNAMAANSIGRELMYRTMAKIIPRKECIDSIRRFLSILSTKMVNEQLGLLCGFANSMGVHFPHNSSRELLKAFSIKGGGQCVDKLQGIYDNPITIGTITFQPVNVSRIHQTKDLSAIVLLLMDRIKLYVDDMANRVQKLLFNLRFDPMADDCFQLGRRTIVISGKQPYVSFMSCPLLKDRYGFVGVCTKSITQEPEEILFHEFSHYFGIVLENKKADDMYTIDKDLFSFGFDRGYLWDIEKKWTDTEEFRVIVGIIVTKRGIIYDYLNESEFNLVAGRENVRISHTGLHLTKVPYRLLEIIENGYGKQLNSIRASVRMHNAALDHIF